MIVYKKKKALLLRVRDPNRILAVIPKAKVVQYKGVDFVAVKHGVDEVKVLRNLGFNPPDPIKYYYSWPGRFKPFLAQRETAAFISSNNRSFVLNDIGCVDADTEYLSPTGWVRIADYAGGEVAQYWPATNKMEFVEPTEFVKKPCPTMVRIKTTFGVDQLLSPEHRVLLQSRTNPHKTEVVHAWELLARQESWLTGESSKKSQDRIGYSEAAIPTTFRTAGGRGIGMTLQELRVQVAVIADGHFANATHRCVVRLKKARKVARLRQLLEDAKIEFVEREQNTPTAQGYTVFTFNAPWRDKVFDAKYWNADERELHVIANEVLYWDSNVGAGQRGDRFSTFARASADFVQYAMAATGRTARVLEAHRERRGRAETEYIVQIRNGDKPLQLIGYSGGEKRAAMSVEPSTDGFKYCFMVPSTFLVLRRNGCVFCTGNTGKTLATLWAYDYLRSVGVAKKMLVVTPLSTLERTWADEIWQHFPHLTCSVVYGPADRRLKALAEDADIYIINHHGLKVKGVVEALAKRPDIDLVVVDEIAQAARNSQTDMFAALNVVVNKQHQRRAIGLTGTPIPNKPTDAWAQCRLLVPEKVPPYFKRFRDLVERQVTNFLWVPRDEAVSVVEGVMQPAIRFSRDECVDLPDCVYQTREVELTPQQARAYKDMLNRLRAEIDAGEVTASNEAIKAQKLIQIACLCYDTPVLTSDGWVPIQNVTDAHRVWDGVEWVAQKGSIYKGAKPVVCVDGVWMTSDHKVLTESGWATAEEILNGHASSRLDRAAVRLPDGFATGGDDDGVGAVRDVAMPVRLRNGSGSQEPVSAGEAPDAPEELRVPSRERDAQADRVAVVQRVDQDEAALSEPERQRLEELRRARGNRVRSVVGVVRGLFGGHGADVREGAHVGSCGQQRPIRTRQLPLGDGEAAVVEQADERVHSNPARSDDGEPSCGAIRPEGGHAPREDIPVQVGRPSSVIRTYDLVDCGPRNRFVVMGTAGKPIIVHNCGALYGDEAEQILQVDAGPRLAVVEEVVEQCGQKVIVFVPFVSTVHLVADYLKEKGFTVECIYGEVSKGERDRIFAAFQRSDNPRVLVAQPASMSHGLTLTAASTIIWYAPITSNDVFVQANGRITRPGQKHGQLIVMLEGTEVERRYYRRLQNKQRVQGTLLDLVQEARK